MRGKKFLQSDEAEKLDFFGVLFGVIAVATLYAWTYVIFAVGQGG
jgi:hypothetical protein